MFGGMCATIAMVGKALPASGCPGARLPPARSDDGDHHTKKSVVPDITREGYNRTRTLGRTDPVGYPPVGVVFLHRGAVRGMR
jgi:hypothetical protein